MKQTGFRSGKVIAEVVHTFQLPSVAVGCARELLENAEVECLESVLIYVAIFWNRNLLRTFLAVAVFGRSHCGSAVLLVMVERW